MSFLFITKLIEDHATERVFYFRLFIGSIFYFLLPIFGCFSSRHLHGPPRKAFKTHTARVFFIFTFFKKKITEIYFGFQNLQFYTPTARQGACRPPGGRQAPTTNIKLRPFPLRPHFLPTRSREGRGRVSEVIPPAKPCRILDPNRR